MNLDEWRYMKKFGLRLEAGLVGFWDYVNTCMICTHIWHILYCISIIFVICLYARTTRLPRSAHCTSSWCKGLTTAMPEGAAFAVTNFKRPRLQIFCKPLASRIIHRDLKPAPKLAEPLLAFQFAQMLLRKLPFLLLSVSNYNFDMSRSLQTQPLIANAH